MSQAPAAERAGRSQVMGEVRCVLAGDRDEWLRMLLAMYGGCEEEHRADVYGFLAGQRCGRPPPSAVFVVDRAEGGLAGFLELSVRDYTEGCAGPTPYVETWYVDADARGQGLGRALLSAAEQWARDHGYRELASDTTLDNHNSQQAHTALGFAEVERAIHYRKQLEG